MSSTNPNTSGQKTTAIHTLLVANRGEIACRVMATAKRMGIRTVAIYSEADANAMHVATADDAVCVGPALSSQSYLNIEAVIAAAKHAGANAIHPGYGFLSENPAFVEACDAAGIIFVGPDANAMHSMGLKDAAKALMESAGVPVVPGYHGDNQDAAFLSEQATSIGYPVLIKARAGGGGKGMRKIDHAADFEQGLIAAQREGQSSFGDASVLIEKYIEQPRHIEVQVFGDSHGNTVHLYERDCSLQRRHQKVIEEAPAPGISAEVREAMTSAAIRTAESINYVGAGTVEFIVDASGPLRTDGFWFMEMNTRLQVEHPVTEAVTGYDLVEWQLLVAAGHPIPAKQSDIKLNGHAVEARLYAEDVDAGFLPATGTLHRFALGNSTSGGHGRVDTGIREGEVVQPFYDPMLAKLIEHAPNRTQAFAQLYRALDDSIILGAITNRSFLARLCNHPPVLAGDVHTDLIEQSMPTDTVAETSLMPSTTFELECNIALAGVVIGFFAIGAATDAAIGNASSIDTPFTNLDAWQMWGTPEREVVLQQGGNTIALKIQQRTDSLWHVSLAPQYSANDDNAEVVSQLDQLVDTGITVSSTNMHSVFEGAGVQFNNQTLFAAVYGKGDDLYTRAGQREMQFSKPKVEFSDNLANSSSQLLAPMPGRIIAVDTTAGDSVEAGSALITLEAMKMEHTLVAAVDGTVDSVLVAVDDQVEQGACLVRFEQP